MIDRIVVVVLSPFFLWIGWKFGDFLIPKLLAQIQEKDEETIRKEAREYWQNFYEKKVKS